MNRLEGLHRIRGIDPRLHLAAAGLWLLLSPGCPDLSLAPPLPSSVMPEVGLLGEATPLQILGEDFHLQVESQLARPAEASLVGVWSGRLGTTPLETVHWVDTGTLTAVAPGTLVPGVYDLELTDPWGRSTTLALAFTVVEPPIFLTIEDEKRGAGTELSHLGLALGETLEVHAILRDHLGAFLASPSVEWSTDATVVSPSPARGPNTKLSAFAAGATVLRALLLRPPLSAKVDIVVVGECVLDLDCAHPCHGGARCSASVCVLGPVDRDRDSDGALDAFCTGGDDCDDDPLACGTACFPGNRAPDLCDGRDQDCDGRTDEDHVQGTISCGTGACEGNTGVSSCVSGIESNTCDPFAGASATDDTCDGVDDDCDGATDQDFTSSTTTCGLGACFGNTGSETCTGGGAVDSCDPLAGASPDLDCNGVDEDCDGVDFDGSCCGADCTTCSSGCCAQTCATGTCALPCASGCACDFDCSVSNATCDADCSGAATCTLNCHQGSECSVLCREGSTCDLVFTSMNRGTATCSEGAACTIDCSGSTFCTVTCESNATCEVDCTNASKCEDTICATGASCLVDCTGTSPGKCVFATCEGGEQSCPNDIIACNRACP